MTAISRLRRHLARQLLRRRGPHGLISWRYLWPGSDERIRRHRTLWWASGQHWPRPVWLGVQLWLWSRWTLWQAWVSCGRMVRNHGAEVATRTGIPRWQQAWRVWRLALGWCIAPDEAYQFSLYRFPERALDFVYRQELTAYHPSRSRPLGLTQASIALLQDKLALANALTSLGVPMVDNTACIPRHTRGQPLAALLRPADRVFCKSRRGQQGRGAFTAWLTAEGLQGHSFAGAVLADAHAVEAAWTQLLSLDDALIQPCLANHPRLAPLSVNADAITVRYISQWQAARLICGGAVLEVPTQPDDRTGTPRYILLPIDAASGRPQPWPRCAELPAPAQESMQRLYARLPQDLLIPDWPALVAGSNRAHQAFPDVWAIAWDWVITAQGPRLLEGNAGWGTAIAQMLHGGFLARDRT